MNISIAKDAGLCYGVQRALNIAKSTRKKKKGPVYTLGNLVHNPQVIEELKKQGIRSVENLRGFKSGVIITRSHGISPHLYQQLKKKKFEVVDATCPIVKKIQSLVKSLSQSEEEIIIVGNKNHPETKGLIGYSHQKGHVVENSTQAKTLPHKKKRAVLAQSTQDMDLFKKIVSILLDKTKKLSVYNTICKATLTHQKSTLHLASRVDTLFIVGGKNSSNTNKLYKISKKVLPNTFFIERAEEIVPSMLKGAQNIGISGGASTPPEALQETVEKINSFLQIQHQREKSVQCQS